MPCPLANFSYQEYGRCELHWLNYKRGCFCIALFSEITTARVQAACEAVGVSYVYMDRFVEEKNTQAFVLGQETGSLGST